MFNEKRLNFNSKEKKMNLLKQIEEYKPYNSQEEKDKEMFLEYMTSFDNYLVRENEYGHMTSSAFVLNIERTKVLLIHHNIYNSWGWLGGHADGDSDLLHVAIKEAKEESGLKDVKPISKEILVIDTIPVHGHMKKGKYVSAHVHLNVSFALEADENEILHIKEDENSGVKWVPIDEMAKLSEESFMKYIYQKAIDKMRELEII